MIRFITFTLLILSSLLANAEAGDKKIIAFAQDTMANDFRRAQVFEVRDEILKHPELSFVYSDGQGQTSLMIRQIERFLKQGVDLIIIGTNDERAIVPVVSKVYKSGIPVIVLDRGVQGDDYTTFINSDNVKIGQIAAKYIAEKINSKGRVLLFEGIQEADVTKHRTKGFVDEINQYKDIEIIKRTGNYLRKDAVTEMEKLLKQGVHIDAIFSESDSMLSGVRMVLMRYKIAPSSIVMIGVDYTTEAQQAIREGSQSASVLFPLGGKKAVDAALKIFNKEAVPRHISNSVELITKKNIDKISPIF